MGAKLPGGIQLGFSQLGGHKFCHGLGDCMGPMCSCGAEVQGNKHFFLALPIPCRWWMGSPWRPLFGGSFGPFRLCPGSAARHAPRLPGFILLGGFGGAFLVVSILGVVYDCHLSAVLQSWGGYWWFLLGIWVLFGLGLALSVLWGSLWAVSKVDRSARAPCLPRFILLGSFSDTLLVVSILDIVYDCHL